MSRILERMLEKADEALTLLHTVYGLPLTFAARLMRSVLVATTTSVLVSRRPNVDDEALPDGLIGDLVGGVQERGGLTTLLHARWTSRRSWPTRRRTS